jgi:Txe/YoeB family toxin of Txe-Axe toxin-antitoxin module
MEMVIYNREKIQTLLNIINQTPFQGIQQAQAITQIVSVLGNPIKKEDKTEE